MNKEKILLNIIDNFLFDNDELEIIKEKYNAEVVKQKLEASLIALDEYQGLRVWDDIEVVSNAYRQDPTLKDINRQRWWNGTIWKQWTIRKIIQIKKDNRIKNILKLERINDFNRFCIYIWDEDLNEYRYHPSELEII